jgi:hypothetical protein
MMPAFWDTVRCSFVEVDRRFRMRTASVIALMKAVLTSKASVYLNETRRRYIPEDYHLLSSCSNGSLAYCNHAVKSDLNVCVV